MTAKLDLEGLRYHCGAPQCWRREGVEHVIDPRVLVRVPGGSVWHRVLRFVDDLGDETHRPMVLCRDNQAVDDFMERGDAEEIVGRRCARCETMAHVRGVS